MAKELFALSKQFYHYVTHHEIPDNMVPFFGSYEESVLEQGTKLI